MAIAKNPITDRTKNQVKPLAQIKGLFLNHYPSNFINNIQIPIKMKTITILFLILPIFAINQEVPVKITKLDNQLTIYDNTTYPNDILEEPLVTINGNVTIAGLISQINTGNSVFIGNNAGVNDDLTNNRNTFVGTNSGSLNTTGNYNNGFGYSALVNNTTGKSNVAIGSNSMEDNQTGIANTAVGNSTLYQNTAGNQNVGVGNQALRANSIGNNNVAIGTRALYSNIFSNNTVLGHEAGRDNLYGIGNVFLGYQAGANTSAYGPTTSNKLYIENSNSSTPLIYGDFASDSIVINGDLTVTGRVTFQNSDVPFSQYSSGNQGEIVYGKDYIFICIQDNVWRRVALSTW